MILKLKNNLQNAIYLTYLAQVVVTPLLFSTQNSELFEVPKMLFVYLGASVVFTLTVLKFIAQGKLELPKNLVAISLVIFLLSQFSSTLFSIDKFTSVFGYPSRLNGGLISTFAYTIIFIGAVINLKKSDAKKLLLSFVITAFAVSLWGIPSHFGKDPNCFVLTNSLTSDCWHQDFDPTLRIFSTLGQPNWLASYLILALPLTLAFVIKTKITSQKLFFSAVFFTQLLALLFTNSISGFLGFAVSIVVFAFISKDKFTKKSLKFLGPVFALLLLLLAVSGGQLFSRLSASSTQIAALINTRSIENLEALNTKPTPSFLIRLVVWQGAVDIIKNNPLLGTGPETFAYSYYKSRPPAHNLTTEWNFFYNKAHNEFLNIFANTGFFGGASYIFFLTAVFISFKKSFKSKNGGIAKASFAAISGYLVSVLFGFSVVSTQLMMFLVAGAVIVLSDQKNTVEIKITKYKKTGLILTAALGVFLLSLVIKIYYSDVLFKNAQEAGTDPESLNIYQKAINTHPGKNPFYLSSQAYAAAQITAATENRELALVLEAKTKAAAQSAVSLSPNNFQIVRRTANTYFLLSSLDLQNGQKALDLAYSMVNLAPTNPESYLSLAKIQLGLELEEEAKENLKRALLLKPDYIEAWLLLTQIENSGI